MERGLSLGGREPAARPVGKPEDRNNTRRGEEGKKRGGGGGEESLYLHEAEIFKPGTLKQAEQFIKAAVIDILQ